MIQNKEITAVGTITYNEFKKHNMYHLIKLYIGFFFFTLFLQICFWWLMQEIRHFPWILYIFMSFLLSSLFTFFVFKTYQNRIKKEFHSDHLATKEIKYTFNNKEINYQSGKSHVYIEWENIVKGREHKEMFCLYISNMKAIVLPKRYFNSNDDIISFKKLISVNANNVKLKN